ncbi:hypothetical protein [Albibacterium bauzanense]|uniref:Uncharacterized protein n=1 Tax=Albibacterium bauzanense TaxID=653929 RepID=A0A4R1LQP3_9SPHI|nr:hypothetical protein [Albibacterium bauzanense]TCK80797.1 hypothetical protein C8N28_2551 [Albibacterium bauzanense]
MKRNKKLILGGIIILIGGMMMRFAWFFIYEQLSVVLILIGAGLFIGGVIYFVNALFQNK